MTTPNNEQDPLWKQVWKQEGVRYLGDKLPQMPDAMDRFKHAFELGQKTQELAAFTRLAHARQLLMESKAEAEDLKRDLAASSAEVERLRCGCDNYL